MTRKERAEYIKLRNEAIIQRYMNLEGNKEERIDVLVLEWKLSTDLINTILQRAKLKQRGFVMPKRKAPDRAKEYERRLRLIALKPTMDEDSSFVKINKNPKSIIYTSIMAGS